MMQMSWWVGGLEGTLFLRISVLLARYSTRAVGTTSFFLMHNHAKAITRCSLMAVGGKTGLVGEARQHQHGHSWDPSALAVDPSE